jgi:hypothetical protein
VRISDSIESSSPVSGSTLIVVCPYFWPYSPDEITGRVRSVPGIGMSWSYARCVWAETIASMSALAPLTILPKADAGSMALAMSVPDAPS